MIGFDKVKAQRGLLIKSRRMFSKEFKGQLLEKYLAGIPPVAQWSRRHEISPISFIGGKPYGDGTLVKRIGGRGRS